MSESLVGAKMRKNETVFKLDAKILSGANTLLLFWIARGAGTARGAGRVSSPHCAGVSWEQSCTHKGNLVAMPQSARTSLEQYVPNPSVLKRNCFFFQRKIIG